MRYSIFSGGKRIRPVIVIESAIACGGKVKDAVAAACAMEMVHTYSLIHDDLPSMDDDDTRRGKPTCHKAFGEANAILAGDALLTLAFNVVAKYMKPSVGIKIIEELSQASGAEGMVAGQALDLKFQGKIKNGKMAKKINILKTAKLFSAAAKIGAMTAGAGDRETKALERFGLDFGLSFQAVDDNLDGDGGEFKETSALVKKAKSDLKIFGSRADRLKCIAEEISKRVI